MIERRRRLRWFVLLLWASITSLSVAHADPPRPVLDDQGVPQVRFNFKGQSWDQVLDYFARATGMPVVRAVEPPKGTVDYLSPVAYPLPKAIETLNILLQTRGVVLRLEDGRLVLDAIGEIKRENIPTFVENLPDDVTPDTIVTLIIPLLNATASRVAEQLEQMVAEYGVLAALPEQNSLLVVETAANVRRLRKIVDELDREDVENAVEQIRLAHASAPDLVPVLEKLMSERVVRTVTKNKKPVQIEEDVMPAGFRLTADARTNSVIARGTPRRLERVRSAIAMLDTPIVGSVRAMRTVQLDRLTVADARAKLEQLFAGLPEDKRPNYVVLDDSNRLTISAEPAVVEQATTFLADLESGGPGIGNTEQGIALLPLVHATPNAAASAVGVVLTPRQKAVVKIVPGPDGRSLVVAGPQGDIDAVRRTLVLIDRPARLDRQVRYLTVDAVDPRIAVDRASRMYEAETQGKEERALTLEFDDADRRLVIEGAKDDLDAFERLLAVATGTVKARTSIRQFTVATAEPSRLVTSLQRIGNAMLRPRDGGAFVPPRFEAVDPLDLLVVEASVEQFPVIEQLITTLDRLQPGDIAFRVVNVGTSDGELLLERANAAFDRRRSLLADDAPEMPQVRLDRDSGAFEILGDADSVEAFEAAIAEARKLLPEPRIGRMIAIRQVPASEVAAPLRELLDTVVLIGDRGRVRPASIDVIEPTNSLWVRGDAAQIATIEGFVRELDVFEPTEMPPLRMLQLSASDAVQVADLLNSRYDARPTGVRREQPVRIEADAATNTLVVTAAAPAFEEIREFVESLNRNSEGEAERETMIFPLRLARATDLAIALETLYPEPPMPLDSRGRPLPHLRQSREVFVSADAGTNTLIIEAPAARRASFEELVQQLDRIELPPQAALRTWNIRRGEGAEVADTLTALARQGVLSRPGANGEKAVEVTVQFEPRSRTLIVAGDEFTFEKVEEILGDLQAVPITRSLRVIEIATGDVAAVADRAGRLYEEQTEGDPDFGPVEVEVDAVNGTILAVGEEGSLARFSQVVAQLESAQARPPDVRLLSLEHTEADQVAAMVQELLSNELSMAVLGGPPPEIEPLGPVNALLVAAQPREHEIIRSVVDALDVADEALPPIRILQVRTADAANLAAALAQTYDRRSPEQRAERPVRINADAATNSLIVAAHPDLLEEIKTIVSDLNDADRLDAEGREIRIFPLRIARAEELASTIDQMFPEPPMPRDSRGRPRPDLQLPREIVVRANPQMNAIIVDAPIQRMAGFEKLVEQLDQAQLATETEIRTWKLPAIELEAAARTLRELAAGGHLGITDAASSITVAVDAASDTLIVSGPISIFERVDAVISSLQSGPLMPATTLRTFRLASARADSLAPMLREILVARIREDVPGGTREVERLLTVTADRKTNTLIVSAPLAVMPIAEELVRALDDSGSAIGEPTVRVRPLSFADADLVAAALRDAIPNMISETTGDVVDVKVVPAAGSNALLLVGLPEDIDEVESLVEPLDARPATDAVDARTFELAHADAQRIAPIVQRILDDQQDSDPRILFERIRRSRGAIDPTPKVRVEADDRTNSLIVSGPQQTVNLAGGLIEKLDRPDADSTRTYATYTPRRADPRKVLESAREALRETRPSGTRSSLSLFLEPQSGTIMIVGSDAETKRAVALLQEWDAAVPVLPVMDLGVIKLRHAEAAPVARTLTAMLRDQARWPQSLRDAMRAGLPIVEPTVTADVSANRILVSAPPELQSVATKLAMELDDDDAVSTTEIRVYPVGAGTADELARALETGLKAATRPGEPAAAVSPAGRADAVVVTASPRLQALVATQLEALNAGGSGIQVRTVFLKHASAARVAPLVERMLVEKDVLDPRDIPTWMRIEMQRARYRGDIPEETPNNVLADERLNAVVISGPIAILNAAEQLVSQLDVPAGGSGDRRIRVLEVRNTDAGSLAATLDELFESDDDGMSPPTIRVNDGSNTLLVRATPDQFDQIERIVKDVDDASLNVARELRTVPIDPGRGSAEDMARMLERMLDREGDDRVRIVPFEELLERSKKKKSEPPKRTSDASAGPGGAPHGILQAIVRSLVGSVQAAGDADGEPDDEAEIVVAIDPETNSLVILGSPRELDRFAALADEVEGRLPEAGSVVRTFTLPSEVDVRNVANIVNQTIRRMVPAGGRSGDLARSTTVVPDTASNALIVAARESDMDLIGELVASAARPADAPELLVRVYPLEGVSAARAASGLQTLLRRPGGARYRELAITFDTDGNRTEATFDPSLVRVVDDASSNSLLVMAPESAMTFVDRFVELAQQTPVGDRTTLKVFTLRYANAGDLQRTLRQIFSTRYRNLRRSGAGGTEPDFAVDRRSNQLIVTASAEELQEIGRLLERLDVEDGRERHPLTVIELASARPSVTVSLLDQAVIGADEQLRTDTLILADDQSGVLLVRADDGTVKEIRDVLSRIDREATSRYPVRTIELARADAGQVAEAISRFYRERADLFSTGRGRRSQAAGVAVTGKAGGGTLLVACADDDFEEVKKIASTFDQNDGNTAYEYRIYNLAHARAADAKITLESLVGTLVFTNGFMSNRFRGDPRSRTNRGAIAVEADERLNALIVSGVGDNFELVEDVIESLDVPTPGNERRVVRYHRVEGLDVDLVRDAVVQAIGTKDERFWWLEEGQSATGVSILVEGGSDLMLVVGTEEQQANVDSILEGLAKVAIADTGVTKVVRTEFADPSDTASAVQRFLASRARATGREIRVAITAVRDTGVILVSGSDAEVRMVEDLVSRIDEPDLTGVRSIEIVRLDRGEAAEIARLVGAQFERRGGEGVVITPDVRTNSLLINAPAGLFPDIQGLVKRLDAPDDTTESVIRTYALAVADADDAVNILQQTLRLDEEGRTSGISIEVEGAEAPVEVRATIVADRRSNSLVVTATPESLPVIESIIGELEDAPARSPVEYRIVQLQHAPAFDVRLTLNQLLLARGDEWNEVAIESNRLENQLVIGATSDQFEVIGTILTELDVPMSRTRRTDFVALDFADADQIARALDNFYGPIAIDADTPEKQNVRIIADEATNSLVITAADSVWPGITALIEKLDAEEYDASLQLAVLPLEYADARSVAQAINQAFRPRVNRKDDDDRDSRRSRDEDESRDGDSDQRAAVLMPSEDWVSASAEPQTNAIIVSANRRNLSKIRRIVSEIDVAEFADLDEPRIIPVRNGDPESLAASLRAVYIAEGDRNPRLRIVGERESNAVVVRADAEQFAQIATLAEALQQEAGDQGLAVRVIPLESAPAQRIADSVRTAFAATARERRVPFSLGVDAAGNALVVASTTPFFEEVERTVRDMDRLAPAAGQGIFLIDLENVPASVAERTVRRIGLDRPAADASTRLVVEPIRMSTVEGRNALLVVANPADRETVVGIFKAIDGTPDVAEAEVRVVPLRQARAQVVMGLIDQVIDPAGGGPRGNAIAAAAREQLRRLSILGRDGKPIELDLDQPIRVTADTEGNAILISSTADNARALEEVARLFDRLPSTEAVTVQIFPLENIAAARFVDIVEDVFDQGRDIATLAGLDIPAMPEGALGPALLERVALTVDERTNTVIAAGKEVAVAFVEVMVGRLDTEIGTGWVEPRVLPLEYADAADLAELIDEALVQGETSMPGASPLQNQVGRIRAMRRGARRAAEGDIFVPLSRLVVRADEQLNALVVVASPANLALIEEIVGLLDIEAAAPGALVRVFAVEHGSAERIAVVAEEIFKAQAEARGARDEDRLVAIPDPRTNSIVVSTDARNFDLFADLLEKLDTEIPAEFREIRIVPLEHAGAGRLATLLQRMMDARLERLRRVQPETADLERTLILADDLANSLVIAAGEDAFTVIERLVGDLDVDRIGDQADIEVVPVTQGGLERIASAVEQVMDRRYADVPRDVARRERPLVIPDPRTSALLVAANPQDLQSIENLVERLSQAPLNPAIDIRVIALESGSARELASRLESLMQDRMRSLGDATQPTDRVSIEPLDGSNALVVAASPENQEVVADLVDVLLVAQKERIGGQSFEIVSVTKNRASELVDLVTEIYADPENRRRGNDSVRISADDRLNALLVSGTAADISSVRDLVSRLDSERPGSVVEVRSIPLASANAQETVGLIETVLNGGGRRNRGGRVGTVMRYLREIEGGTGDEVEIEVSTAMRESIGLTPDVRTNTIIVTAPRESMALIERMIKDLDSNSTGSKRIEVFQLANADADAMARILTELFQLRQQGSLYVLKPREDVSVEVDAVGADGDFFGTDLTLVPDERQALSITVDSRTNSLIVSGTPKYLELVSGVIEQLDEQDANERETLVYKLRNAQASEVARVVSEFVTEDQRKLVQTLSSDQLPSAARLLEREVTIVGDAKSNAVLVNASPRYMEQVESIIKELDVDPPQVMIQVMLAEIVLDDDSDFGLTLNDKVGVVPLSAGLNFSSDDFFTQPVTGSFSVGFADLSLVLSAMSAQGRLQVLSNPSITVANNEDGRIQVGEQVRLPESIATFDTGTQSSTVIAEDIGIILEVRPSINPDGFVRMQVKPTISRLSNETTDISETFKSNIITIREANTTVTVKDGETVVLGGLIEELKTKRSMKVPLLGDIPILGALFRSEKEERKRTELLIVLTPHVVGGDNPDRLRERSRRRIDDLPLPESTLEQFRTGELKASGTILDADFQSLQEDLDGTDDDR